MDCQQPQCDGKIVDGTCQVCGTPPPPASASPQGRTSSKLQQVTSSLHALMTPSEVERTKEDLLKASEELITVVPDNYEAWRAQADLWLAAIHRLETRQIAPDDSVTLMGVPLLENELRDAAEEALRQCAHFAATVEMRVGLIDEANQVRRPSWF